MMFIYNYIYIYCIFLLCKYLLLHTLTWYIPRKDPFLEGRLVPHFNETVCIYLSIYPSIHPSICLSIYLSIYHYLSIYLSIDRSIYLSIYLSRTYPSEQKVVATSPGDPIISGYGQGHFMAKTMVSGYVLGHKTIEYIGT